MEPMEDHSTKVEFLQEVFPTLSKQDILNRLRSAPPSETSTDALVSYFLQASSDQGGIGIDNNVKIKVEDEGERNEEADLVAPKDGDDGNDSDVEILEEVSKGPVEYSADTGKIEKTDEQIKQEEEDLVLAQKLYEEELKQLQTPTTTTTTSLTQPLTHPLTQLGFSQPSPTSSQSLTHPLTQLGFSQPSPTSSQPRTQPPTQPRPTAQKPPAAVPVKVAPTKRPGGSPIVPADEKRSKSEMDAQLQEIRKMREEQWRTSGGKAPSSTSKQQPGGGFNAGYYNQLKDIRNKHNRNWRDSKMDQKRVWTVNDLEAATKASHAHDSKALSSDSAAVRIGKEALEYTNQFRKQNKLPPLDWNSALCNIGAQHSKNMAEHKVPFGHDGFNERIKQYPMQYRTAAENVAMSRGIADVARTAVDGWIESPGHRKNLLSRSQYCGIGCYQGADGAWYLTQLFAG